MSSSSNTTEDVEDVAEFATQNQEFLSRVLAHGGPEARGYVLAVLSHGGTTKQIDAVQNELEKIKRDLSR